MFSVIEYTWDFVQEGATVGVTIYGYDQFDFVTYCILPRDFIWFPNLPGGPNAVASFTLGNTWVYPNRTIARDVWVTSHSPFTAIDLYKFQTRVT